MPWTYLFLIKTAPAHQDHMFILGWGHHTKFQTSAVGRLCGWLDGQDILQRIEDGAECDNNTSLIFHRRSSFIKSFFQKSSASRLPSNVVSDQCFYSISHLPSKVVFRASLPFIAGYLPSKVAFIQIFPSIEDYLPLEVLLNWGYPSSFKVCRRLSFSKDRQPLKTVFHQSPQAKDVLHWR